MSQTCVIDTAETEQKFGQKAILVPIFLLVTSPNLVRPIISLNHSSFHFIEWISKTNSYFESIQIHFTLRKRFINNYILSIHSIFCSKVSRKYSSRISFCEWWLSSIPHPLLQTNITNANSIFNSICTSQKSLNQEIPLWKRQKYPGEQNLMPNPITQTSFQSIRFLFVSKRRA